MSHPSPDPEEFPTGPPRLLTLAEAAAETGLSQKAIARRIERGSLRAVHDDRGRRVVPRTELQRAGLLRAGNPGGEEGNPDGELVIWRDLYERERQEREQLAERERELVAQLAAIANAGPIHAIRLRRQVRQQLALAAADRDTSSSTAAGRDAPA